jgi:hypothetical protein
MAFYPLVKALLLPILKIDGLNFIDKFFDQVIELYLI